MNDIIRLYVGTLNTEETELINLTNGAVIKTIILTNNNTEKETVQLNIEGTLFSFEVEGNNTRIIDYPIVINLLKATTTSSVNIHISGIKLGNN